jgi:ketosteroid isomerase-like protein
VSGVFEEDVERLRRGYAAFNEGGLEAILDWLAPEIEVSDRQSVPDRTTHVGLVGIVALFESNLEVFDQMNFEPEEFIDVGEQILVVLRQRVRGRGSGVEVEGRVAHLWTMRDGTPVNLKIFGDKKKALEALEGRGVEAQDASDQTPRPS